MAGIDSLRALLGMQSPTNVNSYKDNQLALDATGSMQDLVPGQQELKQAQGAIADSQRQPMPHANPQLDATTNFANELQAQARGPVQTMPSGEQLQEGAMGSMRRKLGLQGRAHEQAMERVMGPAQLKADAAVQTAESRAQAAEARATQTQQSAMDRLLMQLQGRGSLQDDAQANAQKLQDERLAAAQNKQHAGSSVPQGILQGIGKAKTAYEGQWFPGLQEKLHMDTGRGQFQTQLEQALTHDGSFAPMQQAIAEAKQAGQSAAQAIQEAASQGHPLTAYQQDYVKLMMGR